MRRQQTPIFLALALSVFLICFFIGRATALRSREEEKQNAIYTGKMLIPEKEEEALPTGAVSDKIEALDAFSNKGAENEEKEVSEENKAENPEENKEETPPERMLFPCGQEVLKGYSQTAVYSKTMDDWRSHTGIDYKANLGDDVVSAWSGTVRKVYKDNYWGHCVEIIHPGKIISIYRNLDKNIKVKEGENVKEGQVIALVGKSAVVEKRDEPHLHFEIWADGVTINPESYVY